MIIIPVLQAGYKKFPTKKTLGGIYASAHIMENNNGYSRCKRWYVAIIFFLISDLHERWD